MGGLIRFLPVVVLLFGCTLLQQVTAPPTVEPTLIKRQPAATIQADKTTVSVGETITIRAEVVDLGIPYYTLNLSSGAMVRVSFEGKIDGEMGKDAVFEIVSASGTQTTAEFTLKAVGAGSSDVYVHASGEVHEGYPGPAYWSAATSPVLTLTVTR